MTAVMQRYPKYVQYHRMEFNTGALPSAVINQLHSVYGYRVVLGFIFGPIVIPVQQIHHDQQPHAGPYLIVTPLGDVIKQNEPELANIDFRI